MPIGPRLRPAPYRHVKAALFYLLKINVLAYPVGIWARVGGTRLLLLRRRGCLLTVERAMAALALHEPNARLPQKHADYKPSQLSCQPKNKEGN